MIELIELNKSFESKTVIDKLNIKFPDEGFIAICGPSGCGKSTLFKIISGLSKADSGKIVYSSANPKISMSFQEPRLLPQLNAEQNVNIVMGDKKTTINKAQNLLEELGITDFNSYPDELSGGMKARVGIARSLAVDANIYLFDEPFANLDRDTAIKVFTVIKKSVNNKLCIAVMHDKSLALELADSVIEFSGAPLSNYSIIK